MWLVKDVEWTQVCRNSYASKKRMPTIFFNYRGSLVADVLPEGTTSYDQVTIYFNYRGSLVPDVLPEGFTVLHGMTK